MPVINGQGQVGAGIGGNTVSIDNVPIAPGGCACWLDDDRLIFNGPDAAGTWGLRQYQQSTKAITLLNPLGANFLCAGGGQYAAQAGSQTYATFAFAAGSRMALTNIDGRGAATPSGLVALCDDPSCASFTVYQGSLATLHVQAAAYNLQILSTVSAIWDGGSAGYPITTPVPLLRRRIVTLPDGDWVVGYANGIGLVACLNGATDGYILVPSPGLAYCHDARNVGGQLLVSWSTSQAEAPGTNVCVTVDRSQPRVPIAGAVVIPTFSFDHPVLLAPYFDAGGHSMAPAEILANGQTQTLARPSFSVPGTTPRGPDLGLYTADGLTVPPISRRVCLVHDGSAEWTPPAWLRPYDVIGFECYRTASETLDQSVARWTRWVDQLLQLPNDLVVVPMFYTQNVWSVPEVLDAIRPLSAIVNRSPRIKVVAPFAYERANGITAIPELQQTYAALLTEQARVGVASLTPIPGPPTIQGDLLTMFATIDPTKILVAFGSKPSSQAGCVNLFEAADGTVWSANGDTRPAGTDGPWEAWQPTGAGVYTAWANGVPHAYGVVFVDKLPK